MTRLINEYPVYVLFILCMCVFSGCYFCRSTDKEQTNEKVDLILKSFMTIGTIICFILMIMWSFGNLNATA